MERLKKFICTEYTKLKLKVDECSANNVSFGITAKISEGITMLKDYATTTREILAVVTTSTITKFEVTKKKLKVVIASIVKLMEQLVSFMKAKTTKSADSMTNDNSKKYQQKCSHCGGHKQMLVV